VFEIILTRIVVKSKLKKIQWVEPVEHRDSLFSLRSLALGSHHALLTAREMRRRGAAYRATAEDDDVEGVWHGA